MSLGTRTLIGVIACSIVVLAGCGGGHDGSAAFGTLYRPTPTAVASATPDD